MAVITINEANYKKEIEESTMPIIIDIYASWCPPCQNMAPVFDELEKEMGSSYKFAKINVDEARELSVKLGATSIPTFVFIKGGEVKGREVGQVDKEELRGKIKEFLG